MLPLAGSLSLSFCAIVIFSPALASERASRNGSSNNDSLCVRRRRLAALHYSRTLLQRLNVRLCVRASGQGQRSCASVCASVDPGARSPKWSYSARQNQRPCKTRVRQPVVHFARFAAHAVGRSRRAYERARRLHTLARRAARFVVRCTKRTAQTTATFASALTLAAAAVVLARARCANFACRSDSPFAHTHTLAR